MTERYRQGTADRAVVGATGLAARPREARADYREAMDRLALHEAVAAAFRLVDATNVFIADTQPWALAKDPAQTPIG